MDIVSMLKKAKDLLPGGIADNMPDNKFNKKKLQHAQKHEMEHTTNPTIAKEVAKDHMTEDENYYKKVEKIEKKARAANRLAKLATIRTSTEQESDADVTTPAAEDVAFLSSKPAAPEEQPKEQSKGKSKIRNAVIEATKNTLGVDPSLKEGSWQLAMTKLKQLGVQ
jgi:hypothetical protein